MSPNTTPTYNQWIYEQISLEISNKTRMNDDRIHELVLSILTRFENKRLAIVPTYLTDGMYVAQQELNPNLLYNDASDLYQAALENYKMPMKRPIMPNDEDGYFW